MASACASRTTTYSSVSDVVDGWAASQEQAPLLDRLVRREGRYVVLGSNGALLFFGSAGEDADDGQSVVNELVSALAGPS